MYHVIRVMYSIIFSILLVVLVILLRVITTRCNHPVRIIKKCNVLACAGDVLACAGVRFQDSVLWIWDIVSDLPIHHPPIWVANS